VLHRDAGRLTVVRGGLDRVALQLERADDVVDRELLRKERRKDADLLS